MPGQIYQHGNSIKIALMCTDFCIRLKCIIVFVRGDHKPAVPYSAHVLVTEELSTNGHCTIPGDRVSLTLILHSS